MCVCVRQDNGENNLASFKELWDDNGKISIYNTRIANSHACKGRSKGVKPAGWKMPTATWSQLLGARGSLMGTTGHFRTHIPNKGGSWCVALTDHARLLIF